MSNGKQMWMTKLKISSNCFVSGLGSESIMHFIGWCQCDDCIFGISLILFIYIINIKQRRMEEQIIIQLSIFSTVDKNHGIIQQLQKNQNLDLVQLKDQNKCTLVHHAAFHNNSQILQYYITYLKKYLTLHSNTNFKTILKQWINQKNLQGNTPLHFACFKNHHQIIQQLTQLGSDIQARNNQGCTPLHIAVQNNSIISIILLKQLGANLEEVDEKGRTPLHWGAFLDNSLAVSFLISWNVNLNMIDSEGNTPLHLAVANGHLKLVHKLLRKGANRKILDQKGHSIEKIAQENQWYNLANSLNEKKPLIQRFSLYYNFKMDLKPLKKTYKFVYLFLFITGMSLSLILIFFKIEQQKIIAYLYFIFIGLMFLLYIILMVIEPNGCKYSGKGVLELVIIQGQDSICPDCMEKKPIRSRHCQICKKCIQKYDHHCPWLNRCIGSGNLILFINFLITMQITILMTVYLIFQHVVLVWKKLQKQQQYQYWRINDLSQPLIKKIVCVILTIEAIIIIICFVMIGLLLIVQLTNLFINMTTYERYNMNFGQTGNSMTSSFLRSLDSNQESVLHENLVRSKRMQHSPSCKNCFQLYYSKQQ